MKKIRSLQSMLLTAKSRQWPIRKAALLGAVTFLTATAWAQSSIAWFGFNAENGGLSGQVEVVTDTSAANGGAISFTTQTGTTFTLPNPGSWSNVTGSLAGMASECGNLSFIFGQPGTNKIIAGIGARGLWYTTNNGSSWNQLGNSASVVRNRPNGVVYDPQNANTFWVVGIYGGGGVFRTTDGGNTFTQLGDVNHNDGLGVDLTDPNRQTMVAGGHESARTLFRTTNGGQSWTNIGGSLPAGTGFSSFPYVVNSTTYLAGINGAWGGTPGIYRTTDSGSSWTKVSDADVKNAIISTANGTLYAPSYNGIYMSTNQGQTWTTAYSSGMRSDTNMVALPDNRVIGLSSSGRVVVGSGTNWAPFGATVPSAVNGHWAPPMLAVNYQNGDIYLAKWDCGNNVLSDAVNRLH